MVYLNRLVTGLMLFFLAGQAAAQDDNCTEIGRVASAQGNVRVQGESGQWSRVSRNSKVCEGHTIRTGTRSRAAIKLNNESVIRVAQRSTTQLENFAPESKTKSVMRLLTGVIHFFSRKPEEYSITTTTATIGIRGTEFVVSVNEDSTELTVFEGVVQAQNDVAPLTLGGGETVSIVEGQTMRSTTLLQPRDQVQWGLYYPPVLVLGDGAVTALANAETCALRGDFPCAFDALEAVADADRNGPYFTLLASLQLAVGDLEPARQSIEQALAINPNDADALALSAIVALTQNRVAEAMSTAQRAVAENPLSASAAIALSYVQQAALDLEAARDTLTRVTASDASNSLAWARLAELHLALGDLPESREAAQRAVALQPALARTHMVSGYAALSRIDTEAAIESFETALDLDSADPMAHLGLGLALIRDGKLADGRREFEIAVALDSASAILRPYLGRAYYEEKRAPLDAEQYVIARQLDPNDPTAYLFDALRLHSENRPVEAAAELRESIARNDNRAVYRGRNLLHQDRAARGASLAQIYSTLGFAEQGISEATNSLAVDPTNHSAHRFLSDSYRNLRRREIARVSELLQAQMLQDINTNPVQPTISATNLNIDSGSGDVGLNEFGRLFESNGGRLSVSMLSGSNDTRAAEGVISGIYDDFSFSLGGFDYETDGWRENNGQDQRLGNLFVQWAAAPKLNFQIEVDSRESAEGDLSFNFDPESFDSTLEQEREFDSQRFGIRYSPDARSDVLFSYIESDRLDNRVAEETLPALLINAFTGPSIVLDPYDTDIEVENESKQMEFQYLRNSDSFGLVAGLAGSEIDSTTRTSITVQEIPTLVFPDLAYDPLAEEDSEVQSKLEHARGYLYATLNPSSQVDLTLGLSIDDYDDEILTESISSENPKLGLVWRAGERHTVRLVALEVTKPSLANNRTLEPTQVAGFNQFFDDVNATQSELLGVGYDFRITPDLTTGFEVTSRDMEIPFLFVDITTLEESTEFEEQEEDIGRLYLNWTPSQSVALSASLVADRFESGSDSDINTPVESKTDSLPISVRYFSPSQWFAGVTVTRVEQEIERNPLSTLAGGDDEFTVVDLSFGYRLPRRLGSISIDVMNATDEEFMYQDDSYREFRDEPSTGPYFPETTAYLRANLVF